MSIPTGGLTLGAKSEVADYSATDHTFSEPTTKGIWVVAPAAGGVVTCRLREDDEDLALPVAGGIGFVPVQVMIVRNSGTTATQVIGLLE